MPTASSAHGGDSGLLTLSDAEIALESSVAAPWIGNLVVLGSRVARWSRAHSDVQIVVALSVPTRDFAASLVACGWMLAAPPPTLDAVALTVASLSPGNPVRVVTTTEVIVDEFWRLDPVRDHLHLRAVGGRWQLGKVAMISRLGVPEAPLRQPLPSPGVISTMAGLHHDWPTRLCQPPNDFAIVGRVASLRQDMSAFLGRIGEREPISNIVLPKVPNVATWSTRLYPSSHLENEPIAADLKGVILDGGPAATYLPAVDTPVVVVVLDRSVGDQSPAAGLVSYRNSRGRPLSVLEDLQWSPSPGIEAVAFEVGL